MKLVLIMATGLLLLATALLAQIPQTISYQGVLTDANGEPVTTQGTKLTFRIHTTPNNSILLWEEVHESVPVENGIFNVILGSQTPLDLPFDSPYFLGISVGGDELLPSIELTAAAYSLNARSVADSAVTSAKIADGQVVRALKILGPDGSRIATLTDSVKLRAGNNISFDVDGFTGEVFISASGQQAESRNTLDAADGNPTDVVFVDNVGRVGIGTTMPAQQLELTGNLQLPATTATGGDSSGMILSGGERFIHNFGGHNFFAGVNAGNLSMTGGDNTAVGYKANDSNTSGNFNTALGAFSLHSNTEGSKNIAIGKSALPFNLIGSQNTAIGQGALLNTKGNNNTAIGYRALANNNIANNNTGIGSGTDVSLSILTNATAIGANAVVDASNKIRLGDNNVTTVETAGTLRSLNATYGLLVDGKVGIGISSPEAELHIRAGDDPTLKLQSDGTNEVSGRISMRQSNDTGADIYYDGTNGVEGLAFETFVSGQSKGVKMFIGVDGNVGIGTSNPGNILTIQQNSATDPVADAWTTYSSRRWKTNIKTIENPLETVQALRGVTYDWKASGKHDIGLVAEEVGEVIPEIVAYEENGIDAKSVDYARLVAVLIEAVKEQQETIGDLKKGHKQLATEVAQLKKQLTQTSLANK